MERTLVLIKPDAVQRGLIGTITNRFETKGLKLVGSKMMQLDDAILKDHYSHLADKPFFPGIAKFMSSSPIIAMCWEGLEAIDIVRKICGVTNSRNADVGTIRGDLGMSMQCNLVHASDGPDTAKAEVARFFKDEELFSYDKLNHGVTYASDEA